MRTRSIILSKTCPYCGARSKSEARMPVPANLPAVEFNLDDLGALVRKQSLSQLLALVELLPYKTFACVKCGSEFRLESHSAKDLVGAMLSSLQPVLPQTPVVRAPPRVAPRPLAPPQPAFEPKVPPPPQAPVPRQRAAPPAPQAPAQSDDDWEAESLDNLFDYSVDPKPDA